MTDERIILAKGRQEDNEDYVDFINYVFGFNGKDRSFYKLLPKLFGRGRNAARDTWFVKDGRGRMLSCVGTFPLPMNICSESVKAYGIGNVAVHPRERGKGYMIKAMGAALEQMKNEGASLAILSGKRTRYDHFGFEKCGTDSVYTLTDKTLSDRDPSFVPRLKMKVLEESDGQSLDNIYALHNKREYRFVRERERLYDILVSWQSTPFVFYDGGEFAGWAVVKGDAVTELKAKKDGYIKDMAYLLMKGRGHLDFVVPECEKHTGDALWHYAETVYTGADLCFNVLDYERMLSLLLRLKSGYESLADGTLAVKIKGYGKTESLRITVKDGVPSVSVTQDECELTLEHTEAMQLFFMNKAPSRSKLPPIPRSWLPLPIYVFSPDNV